MSRARTLLIIATTALAAGLLSACGSDHHEFERVAANEGLYVNAGPLTYQVQITRQLNPTQAMDSELLQGVAPAALVTRPDELWYATFLRVENLTSKIELPARSFVIHDTAGGTYKPIPVDPRANSFAYVPGPILPSKAYPNINSIPGQTDINGKMLLFKIPREAIALRPLTLTVVAPGNPAESARIRLDI